MSHLRPALALALLLLAATTAGCLGSDDSLNREPPDGTATPVSADAGTVSTEHAEYLPEEDAVQVTDPRSGHTRTVPFAEYARTKCGPAGTARVRAVVESRVDPDDEDYTVQGWDGDSIDVTVWKSGDLATSQLEPHAPPRVNVTVTLFDRRHTCTLPVVVVAGTEREEILQSV
ncbi:MAG: hypothetical protein ABEJ68_00740 [Halobacteriaceae archaeon]